MLDGRCGGVRRGMLYIVMDTHVSDMELKNGNNSENASFGHWEMEVRLDVLH